MFKVNSRSYPTSINTITPHMGPCSCKGICSNNTCIGSEHICNPTWWDNRSLSLSPPTYWSWYPYFFLWFSSWDRDYFKSKSIYLSLGSFTTFSSGGLLNMLYEPLWYCFVPNDSTSGFDLFFKICGHIAQSHVPPSISHFSLHFDS